MRHQFSLFQSHLDLAHKLCKELVCPGDIVCDATCGNGNDAYFLATLALQDPKGKLFCFDIQEKAIEKTEEKLKSFLNQVVFIHDCHSTISEHVKEAKCIMYNLGYLPGSDKSITTICNTTLTSIQAAFGCLKPGGALFITCYPGHDEGKRETDKVLALCQTLDPKLWSVCCHTWQNRSAAPQLVIVQKANLSAH